MKQHPIPAPHHPDAVRDQAASLVLAWVALEILFRSLKSKQDFSNGAVTLAAQSRIQRAQGQDVPLPELFGQNADGRPRRAPRQGSPEATRRMGNRNPQRCAKRSNCLSPSRPVRVMIWKS